MGTWLLAGMVGCGDGRPEVYPVHGRVSWKGQPVTTGRIDFYPAEGRPAGAAIQSDGSYTLTTFDPGDGALPGRHRVTIEASITVGGVTPKSFDEEMRIGSGTPGVTTWLVPQEYADAATSPLEREVTAGENQLDFDLP